MNLRPILVISVLLNGILGYLVATGPSRKETGSRSELPGSTQTASNVSQVLDMRQEASATADDPDPAETQTADGKVFNWEVIESDDYMTYIDNLRRIGCPEETIKDIIKADVEKLFQQRRQEFDRSLPPTEYWKSNGLGIGYSMEQLEEMKSLEAEKQEVLKQLLGDNYQPSSANLLSQLMQDPSAIFRRSVGFLPESKQSAVLEAYMGMQEDMINLQADMQSGAMDMSAFSEITKKRDNLLASILTPEEKFEVDLRLSENAQSLKFTLGSMDPTESEFRDIFALQQKIYNEYDVDIYSNGADRESMNLRTKADSELNNQIKELLGDKRYAEYERGKDFNYQQISQIGKSAGLESQVVVEAYDIQKSAESAMNQLNSQYDLTSESRAVAAQQILDETNKALQQTMGNEAWEKYKKSHGYSSLENRFQLFQNVPEALPLPVIEAAGPGSTPDTNP